MSEVLLDELIDYERLAYYDEKLKVWTDKQIKDQVAVTIKYRGSVPTFEDLPNDPKIGDMYNVEDTDLNWVWIEDRQGNLRWDKYASYINIKIATKEQIDALFV